VNQLLEGGEPFFFPGGQTGCLLLHGFTGAPKEMRLLGEHLADQGYTVLGPRLFGHATIKKDMLRARWRDWVASSLDGYYLLRGACTKIVVMGLSMGGALTLYLGARYPVDGLVAMSTPYVTPHPLMKSLRPVFPLISIFWRFAAKGPPDWHDPEVAEDHLDYDSYPVRGGVEVDDLLAEMRRGLHQITAPVLLMYSRGDATVNAEHAQAIHDELRSPEVKLLWFENSGHVITRDAEREAVFAAATEFVRRVTG
jgi:carboxylesterase